MMRDPVIIVALIVIAWISAAGWYLHLENQALDELEHLTLPAQVALP